MSEAEKETLKFLNLAVDLEKSSMKFYTDALNKISDFNMKSLLEALMGNERDHLASVTKIKMLYEDGKDEELKEAASNFTVHEPANPFKGKKQEEALVDPDADIHDVFNAAIEMEKKASAFYTEAAEKTTSEFIKEYFLKLAREELLHKEFIEDHKDALYDSGYWLGIEHTRLET